MLVAVLAGGVALLVVSPARSTILGATLMLSSTLWLLLQPRRAYRVFIDVRLPVVAAVMWAVTKL